MPDVLRIDRLGAGGDGVATGSHGLVHVPYTLPGERVTAEVEGGRGRLVRVDEPSADRIAPFCPYFGRCGGCVAQHVGPDLYARWKRGKVATALAGTGLPDVVEPLVDAHGTGRRRVTFHAHRDEEGRPLVGFMEARTHRIVAIDHCPVTEPALDDAPNAARRLAAILLGTGKPLDIAVTATEVGLDIDLRGTGALSDRLRQRCIGLAAELDLGRLSRHGEVLVERRPAAVAVGTARVPPPPGAFLQATAQGEERLAALVVEGCAGSRRVADLFAGIGPFALHLAAGAEVHAVDGDAAMLLALDRAAREAPGLRRITTERRDLFRRPLLPLELDGFEAIVLDPPRAGAEAQVRQIAESSIERVVMVSCDAGTFARDSATLVAVGFRLERVVPVDQFRWSAHVEIVGTFRRARVRRTGRLRRQG